MNETLRSTVMKKNRAYTRYFYHASRRPRVLFALGGEVLSGELLDRSEAGIGVSVTYVDAWDKEYEAVIPKCYINKTEDTHCIRDLRIVYVNDNPLTKNLHIGFSAESALAKSTLAAVFKTVTEVEGSLGEAKKEFSQDRFDDLSRHSPFSEEAITSRHQWLQNKCSRDFGQIRNHHLNANDLAGNIENYIGAVQIPIGIAGPVLVKGLYTDSYIPVPIATTEGALVSSISRGAKACALSGGINTHIVHQKMLRAPCFHFKNLQGSVNFVQWLQGNERSVIKQAESVSSVAKVSKIEPFMFGDTVHVKFYYDTGDAAGQNMTTACTFIACEWIVSRIRKEKALSFSHYNIDSNMSGDKKVNHQNFTQGRGIAAIAECLIPEDILKDVLKVSVAQMLEGWSAANVSTRQIGMIGSNINFANVIAGIFTATGQDIASVHESSMGILDFKEKDNGLYVSVYLPSLVIGTVGGGTSLPTQKECLQIMDCFGTSRAFRLAEIIAATCLSLDVSTGSAIIGGHFTSAHERLGRNRPKSYFKLSDIDNNFFNQYLPVPDSHVTNCEVLPLQDHSGVTTTLMSEKRRGAKGLFKVKLECTGDQKRTMILKLKSGYQELVQLGLNLIKLTGEDRLPGLFEMNYHVFGFENSHVREIEVYQQLHSNLHHYLPEIYGTVQETDKELFVIAMEDMRGHQLMDSVNNLDQWNSNYIEAALRGMADIHSQYLNRPEQLPDHVEKFDPEQLVNARAFLEDLTRYVGERFNQSTGDLTHYLLNSLEQIHIYAAEMHSYHQTLNHGDFNPRNLCFRDRHGEPELCLFDWELATYQNPQRDLIEFLCYVLTEDQPIDVWKKYIEFYLLELEERLDASLDTDSFYRILHFNTILFGLTRMNLYYLAHNVANFPFLERIYKSLTHFTLNNDIRLRKPA